MLNILRLTDLIIVNARSPRSCARLLKWSVPRRALGRVHWSSLTKDNRRSLKRKENWRKSLLLGIQTGDELAKPPFLVAYSWLCRHCRNLAKGGCLSSRFHFTLCRYFLGHVACPNLPWQGHLIGGSWMVSMTGNFLKKSIVYQATVTTEDSKSDETYVGLT